MHGRKRRARTTTATNTPGGGGGEPPAAVVRYRGLLKPDGRPVNEPEIVDCTRRNDACNVRELVAELLRGETVAISHPMFGLGGTNAVWYSFRRLKVLALWTKNPRECIDWPMVCRVARERRSEGRPFGVLLNVAVTFWGGTPVERNVPPPARVLHDLEHTVVPALESINGGHITESESPWIQLRYDPILVLERIGGGGGTPAAREDPAARQIDAFTLAAVRLGVRRFHFSFLQPFVGPTGKPRGHMVANMAEAGYRLTILSDAEQVAWAAEHLVPALESARALQPDLPPWSTCSSQPVIAHFAGSQLIEHGACLGRERVERLADEVGAQLSGRLRPMNKGLGSEVSRMCKCVNARDIGFRGAYGDTREPACVHECSYCFVRRGGTRPTAAAAAAAACAVDVEDI